jgi:hypothetical protein
MKKKKIALIVLLITGAVVITITNILRIQNQRLAPAPSEEPKIVSPIVGQPKMAYYTSTISVDEATLPPSLPSYVYTPPETVDVFSANIAKLLQLQQHESLKTLWRSEGISLSLSEGTQTVQYLDSNAKSSTKGFTQAQLNNAIESADNFLQRIGLLKMVKLDEKSVLFQKGDYEYQLSTAEEATIVVLTYQQQLNNVSVFTNDSNIQPAVLFVTTDGVIKKAIVRPVSKPQKETVSSPRLSLQKALDGLNNGRGTIINIQVIDESIPIVDVETVNLTSFSMEYRSIDGFYQPYYRFGGSCITKDGKTGYIEVIIPAIEIEKE